MDWNWRGMATKLTGPERMESSMCGRLHQALSNEIEVFTALRQCIHAEWRYTQGGH